MTRRPVSITLLALVLAGSASLWLRAQTPARDTDISQIPIDADDIAGVVRSARGPEAGVWVIAETTDTPTQVPEDRGHRRPGPVPVARSPGTTRHVQDLGARLWPRRFDAGPRDTGAASRTHRGAGARSPRGGADLPGELLVLPHQYPAGEGLSGHGPVRQRHQPGHGARNITGSTRSKRTATSATSWATRRRVRFPAALGTFASSVAAWDRRVQVGQDGAGMSSAVSVLGRARGLEMFANWTDRIAAGKSRLRRRAQRVSSGISSSRCGTGAARRHSRTMSSPPTSGIRRPTPTARSTASTGATTGSSRSIRWSTRRKRREFRYSIRKRRPANRSRCRCRRPTGAPSCTGSTRPSPTTRRWTARAASGCRRGSACPRTSRRSAKTIPRRRWLRCRRSFRQIQYYDPKTQQFKQVDICFDVHHVQFASDADETIYGNGPFSGAIGWVNTRSSRRPAMPARLKAGVARGSTSTATGRSIAPSIARSRWVCSTASFRTRTAASGAPCRDRCRGRSFASSRRRASAKRTSRPSIRPHGVVGYTPRGIDVDSNGVIWTALAGSGHLASFDRRKCRDPFGSGGDGRPALPRRLDAVSSAGTAFQRRSWRRRRRLPVRQLRRPVQHARPGRESPAGERHELRFAARPAARRQLGRAARAVSARVLLARAWTAASTIRTAGGRAAPSTRTTGRTPSGTSKAVWARAAPSSSSRCGRIRWRSR